MTTLDIVMDNQMIYDKVYAEKLKEFSEMGSYSKIYAQQMMSSIHIYEPYTKEFMIAKATHDALLAVLERLERNE